MNWELIFWLWLVALGLDVAKGAMAGGWWLWRRRQARSRIRRRVLAVRL